MRWWALALIVPTLAGCATPTGPTGEPGPDLASFGAEGDPFLGPADATVHVIQYDAAACSNCKWYHANVYPGIIAEFVDPGQVAYHFVQYTIGYAYDREASIAQECAYRDGGVDAYIDLHGQVMSSGPALDLPAALSAIAADHGLDEATLLACFDDQETGPEVDADFQAGRDSGAGSNPGFAVLGPHGTELVKGARGPAEAVRRALA